MMTGKMISHRRLTQLITGIFVVLFFCGCLIACGEKAGVPSEQIETDIFNEYSGYDITNVSYDHDVNTNLHRDCVQVMYDREYEYVVVHTVAQFNYSYNKSIDMWTLEEVSGEEESYELKEALSTASFRGNSKGPFQDGLSYVLNVINVDYESSDVTIAYEITEDDQTYSGEATLNFPNRISYAVTDNRSVNIEIHFWYNEIYVKYEW